MLEHPAHQLGRLDLDLVAIERPTAHQHLVRAEHLDVQTGDAQAALVVDPLAAALDDLRVDDRHRLVVDVPHDDLLLDADLRRGEGQPVVALVQGVEHVVDEAGDLAVDLGNGGGLRLEHRVAVGADRLGHACKATEAMSEPEGHYFAERPAVASAPDDVELALPDVHLRLATDRGVFSHGRIDAGTKLLLLRAPTPPAGDLLDLGCGAGPIALTMAHRCPDATVWAVDVNERARRCARRTPPPTGSATCRWPRRTRCPATSASRRCGATRRSASARRRCTTCCCTGSPGSRPTARPTSSSTSTSAPTLLQRWLTEQGHPAERVASSAGYRILRVT